MNLENKQALLSELMDARYDSMAKIWNIVIEGAEGNEIPFTGIDAEDIIGMKILNSMYIKVLDDYIKKQPHYKVIGRVKRLESSAGETPDVNTVGVTLAIGASDDVEMGFFFIKAAKGFQVFALWPEDFADVVKRKPELYQRLFTSIVHHPGLFAKVSIVLPTT